MTAPQWNPDVSYFQPVVAPDPEWLAQLFVTSILPTATIATKLPAPEDMSVALKNFVRLEAGDVVPDMSVHGACFNVSWLAHCYDTNEAAAQANTGIIISQALAAKGRVLWGWWVKDVVTIVGNRRLGDPLVPANVVRYRTAVTWEVAGHA